MNLNYHTGDYFNEVDTFMYELSEGRFVLTKVKQKGSRWYAVHGGVFMDTILSVNTNEVLGAMVSLNGVRGVVRDFLPRYNRTVFRYPDGRFKQEETIFGFVGVVWKGVIPKSFPLQYWTELNTELKFV